MTSPKELKRFAAAAAVFLLSTIAFAGCGGGPFWKGGAWIFAHRLPDEIISMEDLPPAVKSAAESLSAYGDVNEVKRRVRSRDGRYFYPIVYNDFSGKRNEFVYGYDGTLVSRKVLE